MYFIGQSEMEKKHNKNNNTQNEKKWNNKTQ